MSSVDIRAPKVLPQNLVMGQGSGATHYTYLSTHPIQRMLEPQYFLSLWHQLRPADTIRVVQMEKNDIFEQSNRVLAYIDLLVCASSKKGILFERERWIDKAGKVCDGPHYIAYEGEEDETSLATTVYVSGQAQWKGPHSQWAVVDQEGNTLIKGIEDKELAEKIAAGIVPLPASA